LLICLSRLFRLLRQGLGGLALLGGFVLTTPQFQLSRSVERQDAILSISGEERESLLVGFGP
jgi:hypothetical protein